MIGGASLVECKSLNLINMLSDYLPAFCSNDQYANLRDYAHQNREGADFAFIYDEDKNQFLDSWRMDMSLGISGDLTPTTWYGYFCIKILLEWWICCSKQAKSMIMDEKTGLSKLQARYRSSFTGMYPNGSWVISMETQPVVLQDHRDTDIFATINRGRRVMPFKGQPCICLPELTTKEGYHLEKATKDLILGAKQRFKNKGFYPVSKRELDVLMAIANGLNTNDLIGNSLSISSQTAMEHRKNICPEGPKISKYLKSSESIAMFLRDMDMI